MAYEVTATRRRPQVFDQLAGQDFVSSTLRNSVVSGKIAHAYLFSGPRGCGKTSTARILAKALNCEKGPTDNPCGVCSSCREIARGASLDVIEIDGASNTSVDNVRQIREEVLFPPNAGRHKIYIIDEVHMLSTSAFNALLKTIEEPPPWIIFIFATTELHKVPATIRSRCQQFNFRLVPVDVVKGLLADAARELSITADDDALFWMSKESTGSIRDAYTLFDQVASFSDGRITLAAIKEKLGIVGVEDLNGIMEACAEGDAGSALSALDGLLAKGITVEQLAQNLAEYMRAMLLLSDGISKDALLGYPADRFSKKVLGAIGSEGFERGLSLCLELHRQIRYSVNPRFELDLAVARLASLPKYISAADLRRELERLKALLSGGAAEEGPRMGAPAHRVEAPAAYAAHAVEGPSSSSAAREGPPSRPASEEKAEADDGRSPAPGGADEGSQGLRAAVIQAVRKVRVMLGAHLEKSGEWRNEGGKLVLPFQSRLDADFVREDIRLIAEKVRAASGRDWEIEILTEGYDRAAASPEGGESGAGEAGDSSRAVEVVERIFRGTVVGEREIGEES